MEYLLNRGIAVFELDQRIKDAMDGAAMTFREANIEITNVWINDLVFSWRWWVNVALLVLPWIFWLKVRKKNSTHRLLFAGFAIMLIASYLDMLGLSLGLWSYYSKVVPTIPAYLKWDITLMPVTAMLFYQYKPNIHPMIKAVIFAGIASFIVEPLFIWLDFYNPKDWKIYYSFPIVVVIYLIGHAFTRMDKFEKL